MASLQLRRNSDNTITVRVGRSVEYISILGKTHGQLFDAVKYAAISKGAVVSDVRLVELLTENQ